MYKKAIYGLLLTSVLLVGCASDPQRHQTIVDNTASSIQPIQEKLSNYSSFKLAPMKISEGVQADAGKAQYADVLEKRLSVSINYLLNEWGQSAGATNRSLSIEPELLSLRVVSGGARLWAGAFAGNSSIKLKLTIRDNDSNTVIGSPVIYKESNSMAGAWSGGESDQNLVGYVVDISEQYLKNNYWSQMVPVQKLNGHRAFLSA